MQADPPARATPLHTDAPPPRRARDRLPGVFVGGRSPGSWFELREVAARTFLIHERRYWQRNSNYLLVGDERAVLVDTGSGLSNLPAVVAGLTDRPVTVLPTHLHWDHVGGIERFAHHALLDVPANRRLMADGALRTTYRTSFSLRGHSFRVAEWLAPGDELDLGGRRLEVLATPGHSADGLTLVDRAARLACVGDLLYEGLMLANLPGASLADYASSVRTLAGRDDELDLLLPGHGRPLPAALLRPVATRIAALAGTHVRTLAMQPLTDGLKLALGRRASRR